METLTDASYWAVAVPPVLTAWEVVFHRPSGTPQGLPRWQRAKSLPAMQEVWVRSPGWDDPLEQEMAAHPVSLPGESRGQRSLAGHSPWSHERVEGD